ncbi:phytase [Bacteroidota bacterium]
MRTSIYTNPIFCVLLICTFAACKNTVVETKDPSMIDSVVVADLETNPVIAKTDDDAADDPAVWIHPSDLAKSMIVGTNKKAGVMMYSLAGVEIHFYPAGDANNIDVRYGFPFGENNNGDIIACSERINNKIVAFRVNPEDGSLTEIHGDRLMSDIKEVYGFCLYHSAVSGKYYAFMNGKSGIIEQWELEPYGDGEITGKVVRNFKVATQPEGMVADDELGYLYVGEEGRGIWKFNAEPDDTLGPQFIEGSDDSNPKIQYDVEGLTIYYAPGNKGYLIASYQGNNTYAIFERGGTNKYLGSFEIKDNGIDGVVETDGIDVTNLNLGGTFSKGVFIAQDGFNTDGESVLPQNFKLVSWEKIANLYEPPLIMDSSYNAYK